MPTTEEPIQNDPLWREHVTQWRSSGLTQAAYCRQHDLSPHRLGYYKRKYSTSLVPVKHEPSAFVSVQIQPEPQHHDPLTLHFTNGLRLSGIAQNNITVVKQLAELLS